MKRLLVIVVAIVSSSFSSLAISVEGPRLEVLAGQCQAEPLGEGNWYSEHYPYELNLRSRCMQISVSEVFNQWREWDLGMRLGYVDLGSMRLHAVWWLRDEDFQSKPDGANCTMGQNGDATGCLGFGGLRQRVRGFTIGGFAEHKIFRHLRLGLEGGIFVYEGAFDISVAPYPEGVHYTGWESEWKGWQLSPYLGATLNSGPFMLSARVYTVIRAGEHGCACSGPTRGPATAILGGLRLNF